MSVTKIQYFIDLLFQLEYFHEDENYDHFCFRFSLCTILHVNIEFFYQKRW